MSDYKTQAIAATAELCADLAAIIPRDYMAAVETGLAVAWLEGSKAGAEKALAEFKAALAAWDE